MFIIYNPDVIFLHAIDIDQMVECVTVIHISKHLHCYLQYYNMAGRNDEARYRYIYNKRIDFMWTI